MRNLHNPPLSGLKGLLPQKEKGLAIIAVGDDLPCDGRHHHVKEPDRVEIDRLGFRELVGKERDRRFHEASFPAEIYFQAGLLCGLGRSGKKKEKKEKKGWSWCEERD